MLSQLASTGVACCRSLAAKAEIPVEIELKGNLAAMLGTVQTKSSPESDDLSMQDTLAQFRVGWSCLLPPKTSTTNRTSTQNTVPRVDDVDQLQLSRLDLGSWLVWNTPTSSRRVEVEEHLQKALIGRYRDRWTFTACPRTFFEREVRYEHRQFV